MGFELGVTVLPARLGIMAIDPGVTTGLAWGIVEPSSSLAATVAGGWVRSREVRGDCWEQGRELAEAWQLFAFEAMMAYVPDVGLRLVVEDFILRVRSKARDALAPVRVTAALETALSVYAPTLLRIEFQEPSLGMATVTSERLRDLGLWVVGSEHERDARRHWATKVKRELSLA